MILYDYPRSTAAYRVRIALHYKKIKFEQKKIHLLQDGGQQYLSEYTAINPQQLLPTLNDNGALITQSLAIIEYLDEQYPTPSILPKKPLARAQVRSLAQMVACDIHPLNNLRVLNYLRDGFNANDSNVTTWYHHWLKKGFDAIEQRLSNFPRSKPVCYGDTITLADMCLIPQAYNAERFHFSLEKYPTIQSIITYCLTLDAFMRAKPT